MRYIKGYESARPGIQVGAKLESRITKKYDGTFEFELDGIQFLQQMGVEWVMVNDPPAHTAKEMKRLKTQLEEDYGLKIFRLADNYLHNMPEVTLNLEGRDKTIGEYLDYITKLGEAGIHYSTYAHMGNGIWRGTKRHPVRGGATAGGLDLGGENYGHWRDRNEKEAIKDHKYAWPLSHGRKYSEEELWDNYEYFIRKVAPVAGSAGVYIGVHPDDPPGYEMAGIPRCVFGTFEGYKKAIQIADSPNIGACLCVGCWLEAGDMAGSTPEEFIRYFAERGKLFKIHMRNVTGTLDQPGGFNETFPDAGYYNLLNVIQALDESKFDGVIMSDHLIDMVGGKRTCEAYFTGYLKGAVDAVQNHRGFAY
jgi:mannonate dehydratase